MRGSADVGYALAGLWRLAPVEPENDMALPREGSHEMTSDETGSSRERTLTATTL